MERVASITAILESPKSTQEKFNQIVSEHREIVKGRLGLPMTEYGISVINLVVVGGVDTINSLTGKLGSLENIQIKTAISKKEV